MTFSFDIHFSNRARADIDCVREERLIYKSKSKPAGWLEENLKPFRGDSFPGFLRKRVLEPDKAALIFEGHVVTYAKLHGAIDATAQAMAARAGVRQGDRVVLNMDNSDRMMISYLAVHRAGAVAVPVNPKLVAREIRFILSDAKPKLYLCDTDRVAEAESFVTDCGATVLDAASLVQMTPDALVALPDIAPEDPASIFYTSGTTGTPKGVIHTHNTLKAGALQCASAWGYDFPHTLVAITPFFHVAAHSWFYPLLAFNGTLVIDSFKTERCFELIERYRAEAFNAVPAMLLMMATAECRTKYDTSSVTCVCFGASPMPPEKLSAIQELFPNARFWHGMGQTESGGTISVLPPELAFRKNGSTGFPNPACEVRIVDGVGRDVATGEHGEVLARGPNIMLGYINRPEATAETLVDGWLHTGDIGYVDEDGCIYLVDRKKDMLIRGGENVYSVEIENLIMSHNGVSMCAVIGLPDPVLGERICAAIVPRTDDDSSLLAELTALCRRELAAFKVPEVWKIVSKLPTTATGKVQKAALRAELSQNG
jgi:long-chain acyl-CoA synthetase